MDKLRTDELKTGHRVVYNFMNQGERALEVRDVTMISLGVVCSIYRIDFYGSDFGMAANADREWNVESHIPDLTRATLLGDIG